MHCSGPVLSDAFANSIVKDKPWIVYIHVRPWHAVQLCFLGARVGKLMGARAAVCAGR
jgi:hypothetical protein